MNTPLLDTINTPDDLKKIAPGQLNEVSRELREELIDAVSVTGGHFGAGLGVVELTVALHYVFDTPRGQADLGCRPPGLSPQDSSPAGATASAPSARAAGCPASPAAAKASSIPLARRIPPPPSRRHWAWRRAATSRARGNNVIAVIGDGAMSAGMAYEALNNAGALKKPPDRGAQRQRHVDRARRSARWTRICAILQPEQTRKLSRICSPRWAFAMSARSMAMTRWRWRNCSRTCAMASRNRCWCMFSPEKGRGYGPAEALRRQGPCRMAKFDVATGGAGQGQAGRADPIPRCSPGR